ncbi:Stage II sporulation protein E (SpoIIE) [Streptomyces sp. OV198]|nr:Stage II sporulation protein E (SpoIIE) [Streptomyces sp. OV198]
MDGCKALQLVDSMTMDISGYRDDYRQALEAVIETNAEGRDLGFLRRKPGRVPHLVAPLQHVRDQRPVPHPHPHPTSRPCHASFATATFVLRHFRAISAYGLRAARTARTRADRRLPPDPERSRAVRMAGERFATTLLLEIPDEDPITRLISCGHPPPLLLRPGEAVTVLVHPAPPLGVGRTGSEDYTLDVFSFEPGETLLLYTDGVIEARDPAGGFYPFTERAAQWTDASPETLLHHIRRDLLAHVGGRLDDDAALIAIRRTTAPHGCRPGRTPGGRPCRCGRAGPGGGQVVARQH